MYVTVFKINNIFIPQSDSKSIIIIFINILNFQISDTKMNQSITKDEKISNSSNSKTNDREKCYQVFKLNIFIYKLIK